MAVNDNAFSHDLDRILRTYERLADATVGRNTALLKRKVQLGWPVAEELGGTSRAAWQGPTRRQAGVWEISNPVIYARVIEFGGYRGVGPKTHQLGQERLPTGELINRGIYVKQRPSAPVRRGLASVEPLLLDDLARDLRRAWTGG